MFKALLQMLLRITKPKTGKPRVIYTQSKTRDGGKMSKQTHLADYLSYYQALEAPSYAVLVTGEWGTGKTYQVKHLIPEAERYYVSLFGVQTVEQIHAEVLAAASPKLAKATALIEKTSGTVAEIGGLLHWLAQH
ncbi:MULTISPECIES: P-loop NTPase fold protein [Gammaproteobacteria]|uniref:P-loop NTPase fold protein n=1 Tax=Gammaproteobacteria TaxID=1236 RepID=UPI003A91548C